MRHLFLFVQVESLLAKAESGPEALSKPTPCTNVVKAIQRVLVQQQMSAIDQWHVIYYTNYGEYERPQVEAWLDTQRIWGSSTSTQLLMRDPHAPGGHISWLVPLVHQLTAMWGSSSNLNDQCLVFDRAGWDLQEAFNIHPGSYTDVLVRGNEREFCQDLAALLPSTTIPGRK